MILSPAVVLGGYPARVALDERVSRGQLARELCLGQVLLVSATGHPPSRWGNQGASGPVNLNHQARWPARWECVKHSDCNDG